MNEIWVLTYEVNDYNQYGEYFKAVFGNKPTTKQLAEIGLPAEYSLHVLDGGGRAMCEDMWYHLRAHDVCKQSPMTNGQIEKLRERTFSTNNPFCPVDMGSMQKAVRATEAAHGITRENK